MTAKVTYFGKRGVTLRTQARVMVAQTDFHPWFDQCAAEGSQWLCPIGAMMLHHFIGTNLNVIPVGYLF